MVIPEFLEVFGRLEPKKLPSFSSLDKDSIHSNNPLTLLEKRGIHQLPHWIYFDYGLNENFDGIIQGNRNFEKALKEGSHQIPVQPFNGNSTHSYLFWRSRIGNILQHHSKVFKTLP
jgi:S-formylglutathione hydrolase FrmB